MSEYYVEWGIYIEAESPQEAARKALEIQRNPEEVVNGDTN